MTSQERPRVVVLGAGFAGVQAIRHLSRANVDVTLVDQHPYSTFQPLLYQVATGGLNPGDITYPLRHLSAQHHVRFRRARVLGIDHATQQVLVDAGLPIEYDYLIVGIGTVADHFGIPGAAEHSMAMYTRADALAVRDRLFSGLETLAGRSTGEDALNIVVVGGGATGVEMAGAIAELKQTMLSRTFPELDESRVKVTLVEMADALLPPFHERLQGYTYRQLVKRGVDVRLGTAISAAHEDRVDLEGGATWPADIVVWAAGMTGGARDAWGLPIGPGRRIIVGDDLRVPGLDNVFAVGDAAINRTNPMAQLAQPAIQMGKHAARQIVRLERGKPTKPFRYLDKGIMATVGNRSAVVQLPFGPRITGALAWLTWVLLHIWFLLGGRNRIGTLVNLAYQYLLWPRRAGAIIGDISLGTTTGNETRPVVRQDVA
ncbi:NAD(P)/FAD-dependent oxidoreductase [Kribbella sp. NPDC050124]|uniref:NAD(P)/FAD-dependent oxidoreductase n=1 Tax=Kribbella sp. NPDC050124 TaxID=3364114 RepID=UPI00378F34FE